MANNTIDCQNHLAVHLREKAILKYDCNSPRVTI
jgi:hypothetical protein